MRLPQDFNDLLLEFEKEIVEYVIVGGYAVAFHARPRATKDIDLVILGTPENLQRVGAALSSFGAPAAVVGDVTTMCLDDVVYFGVPPLRIDFLRSITGVDSRDLFRDSIETSVDGTKLKFISLEHLIANKRAVGRPQDLLDVELLARVANPTSAT